MECNDQGLLCVMLLLKCFDHIFVHRFEYSLTWRRLMIECGGIIYALTGMGETNGFLMLALETL